MTIRWKLNLSVMALIAVFLASVAFSMWAVRRNGNLTRSYARMRELAQFTADIRTHLFQQLVWKSGVVDPPSGLRAVSWPKSVLDDIDVKIRLSESDDERQLWTQVRSSVSALGDLRDSSAAELKVSLREAERDLHRLRDYYDLAQNKAAASAARTSLTAEAAISIACVLTVLLFLIYLIAVRDWLLRPLEVLKSSADIIGAGDLAHRVPLEGRDELAELARRIDAMAANLSAHQSALMEARELSAIGELCTHVAHGLRNPLAALRATVERAERRAAEPDDVKSLLDELIRQADRMDERVTRLFEFSRPMELRRCRITFDALARAGQAQAYPLLRMHNIGLLIDDLTRDTGWSLDGEQMAEAVGELITNAIHHGPPGSNLTLRGEALPSDNGSNAALQIQVIDQGAGMSAATANKAFDLFFTSRPDGTGMGLAMIRRIVEKHGGCIVLQSSEGKGTTVTLRIPHDTDASVDLK